jgi:DNA-binding MarR family transcriptional regulator
VTTQDLTFWSFVDVAVGRTKRRLPDIDVEAMRLILTLYRVTNMVMYDLESTVHRPRGRSYPGFRLLFTLWVAGPMEAKRAAELAGMSRQAVSSLVNTLHREGLVDRTPDENDRRAVRLSLTPRGSEAITDAFAAHNERERLWADELSPTERETLTRLLGRLAARDGARMRR